MFLIVTQKTFSQRQSPWLPYSLWRKYIRYNHFNSIEIQSMLKKKTKLCLSIFWNGRRTQNDRRLNQVKWMYSNKVLSYSVMCSNRRKVLKSILCQVINVFLDYNYSVNAQRFRTQLLKKVFHLTLIDCSRRILMQNKLLI